MDCQDAKTVTSSKAGVSSQLAEEAYWDVQSETNPFLELCCAKCSLCIERREEQGVMNKSQKISPLHSNQGLTETSSKTEVFLPDSTANKQTIEAPTSGMIKLFNSMSITHESSPSCITQHEQKRESGAEECPMLMMKRKIGGSYSSSDFMTLKGERSFMAPFCSCAALFDSGRDLRRYISDLKRYRKLHGYAPYPSKSEGRVTDQNGRRSRRDNFKKIAVFF